MKALADIVNDENWCAKEFALDADGANVSPIDPLAVKLCILGWLTRKYTDTVSFHNAALKVRVVCLARYRTEDIMEVNDCLVKNAAEVCAIFAEAGV